MEDGMMEGCKKEGRKTAETRDKHRGVEDRRWKDERRRDGGRNRRENREQWKDEGQEGS